MNWKGLASRALPLAVIIAALASAGCATVRGVIGQRELEQSRWRLAELAERPVLSTDSLHRPWIEFLVEGGRVSGSGGCNRFSGTYARDGASLRIMQLLSTKMACVDTALNSQEQALLKALQTVDHFGIADDTLTLSATAVTIPRVARFVR